MVRDQAAQVRQKMAKNSGFAGLTAKYIAGSAIVSGFRNCRDSSRASLVVEPPTPIAHRYGYSISLSSSFASRSTCGCARYLLGHQGKTDRGKGYCGLEFSFKSQIVDYLAGQLARESSASVAFPVCHVRTLGSPPFPLSKSGLARRRCCYARTPGHIAGHLSCKEEAAVACAEVCCSRTLNTSQSVTWPVSAPHAYRSSPITGGTRHVVIRSMYTHLRAYREASTTTWWEIWTRAP